MKEKGKSDPKGKKEKMEENDPLEMTIKKWYPIAGSKKKYKAQVLYFLEQILEKVSEKR
jgi:hypothetical protein